MWRAGGWFTAHTIEAYALDEVDEDDDAEVLRARIPVDSARTFAKRTLGRTGRGAANRPRRAHLRSPRALMPVSDLGTDELALTGRITTAYKATFLGIIGGAAVRIHIREAERDDEDL